jgi:dipeptidyl aminopeptidase/acylaminoacyl peptidase
VQQANSFESYGEISVFDMQAGQARIITALNADALAEHPPARWERRELQRGEFTIEYFLLTPPDFDPAKRYPAVLDIHGGPQWWYGYFMLPWQQALATDGCVVAVANPRGWRFVQQVKQDWGGEDFRDLMAVMDAVCALPYVDEARTGMHGYSYGGYMTSWMLGNTERFKACCCGAPVFDFESFWGTSDIGFGWGEEQFGGRPHAAREAYAAHSPSEFAHRAVTPTLILHGEADDRCPIGQGEQLFIALQKAGVEVEFVRYPGCDHLFKYDGHPEHREDYSRRVHAWMKDHLGGPG